MATYQIYELSARAVMSYAAEQDGVYTFALNRSATEHCKVPGAKHEQDSCAMFHQLMYQLHGEGWRERSDEKAGSSEPPSRIASTSFLIKSIVWSVTKRFQSSFRA